MLIAGQLMLLIGPCGIDLLHRADALVRLGLRFLVGAHAAHPAHTAGLGVAYRNCRNGQSQDDYGGETVCFFHVSASFHRDLSQRRTYGTAAFKSPAARLATRFIAAHVEAPPWSWFLCAPACAAAAARGRRNKRYATGTTNMDKSGAV